MPTAEPIRGILFPTGFSPVSKTTFVYAERLVASVGIDRRIQTRLNCPRLVPI